MLSPCYRWLCHNLQSHFCPTAGAIGYFFVVLFSTLTAFYDPIASGIFGAGDPLMQNPLGGRALFRKMELILHELIIHELSSCDLFRVLRAATGLDVVKWRLGKLWGSEGRCSEVYKGCKVDYSYLSHYSDSRNQGTP